jgi:transcriptional regulator with XRE-family HTH domain
MQAVVVHVGDRLKRLRSKRYLSQRELAKEAGLSPATIFKLENNLAQPHPSTIRKLARALSVAPSEIADPSELVDQG